MSMPCEVEPCQIRSGAGVTTEKGTSTRSDFFAAAPKADLDAVRETAEAMKVIHKDKVQATDADIVSALHGEIYELVS